MNQKFNLSSFNEGDYISALNNRENVISISSILYPNDSTYNGKELRLSSSTSSSRPPFRM